ncbi:MAG TPA: S8/S53 family peptidase [Candidatus Krumholzibacteria bacterium]|nr:S8/S53 family peptidase [Candidatus Krumholzibacteria bacterium]
MSAQRSDSKAALLVQGVWPATAAPLPAGRAELTRVLSVHSAKLSARILRELPSVEIIGACALAPLLLLRCEQGQSARILEELAEWPQVARAEATLPEEAMERLEPLRTPIIEATDPCTAGFVDLGAPLIASAMLEDRGKRFGGALRPARQSENLVPNHSDSVLAAFLETLGPGRTPRCIFESLDRSAGPFSWLAAIDRLFCRGASVVNLSYGRLALERESGWGGLEWGAELLCQGSGGTVVAAAGRINEGLSSGESLYLPASAPHVLAAADELRAKATAPRQQAAKLLLASSSDPYGGRRGSSYSAPRISALAVQAYDELPREARDCETVLALLLAAAKPSIPGALSPGFPDSGRLTRIIAGGAYRRGSKNGRLLLPATPGAPTRIAVSWLESEVEPLLRASSALEQQILRRSEQWMVLDVLTGDVELELRDLSGPWSLAFSPLSPEEFQISRKGVGRGRRAS